MQEEQPSMFVSKENVAVNVAHELIERQQSILDITKAKVAVNVAVNAKRLSEELGVNRKTIQRDLISLQALNLVKWIGTDKDGYWEISK